MRFAPPNEEYSHVDVDGIRETEAIHETSTAMFPLSWMPGRNRREKRMYRTIADRVARGTARKSEIDKLRALMAQLQYAAARS